MKIYRYHFFILTLLLSFGFMAGHAAQASDLAPPQLAIENASNKLKERLQEPGFVRDFHKITGFVNEIIYPQVDFDLVSSLVLGKLWKDATPVEKDSFKKEFQTLLIRTYARALFELKDWSVRFLPISNSEEDERKALVKTEILQPGLQPISINYRMLNTQNGWKVYDIVIEGVSLVTNYRTGFKNDVERSGSLQAVINQLAKKNSDALNNPDKT